MVASIVAVGRTISVVASVLATFNGICWAGSFGWSAAAHFLVALGHGGAARKADAAFFVHAEALDPNFISHFYDVLGLFDAEVGQLADVDQAVSAGEELDKSAEFFDGD